MCRFRRYQSNREPIVLSGCRKQLVDSEEKVCNLQCLVSCYEREHSI